MQKFSLNVEALENKILKKAYKLSDVKDRLEKVSFDIVRFTDGDESSKLWQVQSADDGEYIVTLYDESESDNIKSSSWEVMLSKNAQSMNFYYKGDPIVKVSTAKLGIPSNELQATQRYLPRKLAENKELVNALLKELPESTKNIVLSKYPELV